MSYSQTTLPYIRPGSEGCRPWLFFTCLFECICSQCLCETSSCLSTASTQQAYKPKLRPAFLVWSLIQLGKLNRKCNYQLFIQWPNLQSQRTRLLTFLVYFPHTTQNNNSGHVECTCLDYVAFPQCFFFRKTFQSFAEMFNFFPGEGRYYRLNQSMDVTACDG